MRQSVSVSLPSQEIRFLAFSLFLLLHRLLCALDFLHPVPQLAPAVIATREHHATDCLEEERVPRAARDPPHVKRHLQVQRPRHSVRIDFGSPLFLQHFVVTSQRAQVALARAIHPPVRSKHQRGSLATR